MAFRTFFGQVHLWLGLFSGLVVFILGLTGCIMAYQEELQNWMYSNKLKVEAATFNEPMALSRLHEKAQSAMGPETPIQRIIIPNSPGNSIAFRYVKRDKNTSGIWYWDEIPRDELVYINPYTAEVIQKEDRTFSFFSVVLRLHYSLLLKTKLGKPIIGSAALIFLIMLITGLILWWPKNKKALKVSTWFRWNPKTKWKRKNYDLHNILGFYSIFFALFIAITGLMWAFTWFNDGVQWLANGGEAHPKERVMVKSDVTLSSSVHYLDIIHENLKSTYPNAKTYFINLPKDSLGVVGGYVYNSEAKKNIYLLFDRYSGELLHDGDKWEDKTNGEKVMAYTLDIHTGAIGGIVGKTVAFLTSLFSASLPVTGFLIWWGRRRKKSRNRGNKMYPELGLVQEVNESFPENEGVVFLNVPGDDNKSGKNKDNGRAW